MFGTLPEGNLFFDDPKENPLPEDMKTQIMNAPRGQEVWVGPIAGKTIYGFENENTPQHIMIAAWKTVDVSYGECFAMMLMDETIFENCLTHCMTGTAVGIFLLRIRWKSTTQARIHARPGPTDQPKQQRNDFPK